MELLAEIRVVINELIAHFNGLTRYRTPLVGCAAADDPVFIKIRNYTHGGHLYPEDLLPGARSVVAFFLPFTEEVVESNRREKMPAREWAVAYVETNRLIADICLAVRDRLAELGVRAAWVEPTYNFDEGILMADWSHRHAAYAAGLGTFGLNNLLITEYGCAGRVGSLVVDAVIQPTPVIKEEKCLYKKGEQCLDCVNLCPMKALKQDGIDRQRCYQWLLKMDSHFSDLPLTDVCGKCSMGRCALWGYRKLTN